VITPNTCANETEIEQKYQPTNHRTNTDLLCVLEGRNDATTEAPFQKQNGIHESTKPK